MAVIGTSCVHKRGLRKASALLTNQDFEVYFPRCRKQIHHARKTQTRKT